MHPWLGALGVTDPPLQSVLAVTGSFPPPTDGSTVGTSRPFPLERVRSSSEACACYGHDQETTHIIDYD